MKRILAATFFSIIHVGSFAENLGKVTYQMACRNCHSPVLAKGIGAPAAFDKMAWNKRFKKAKAEAKNNPLRYKTDVDYLLNSVINGKNLMHHGGLCHESTVPEKNCSNAAFIQAIQYMSGRQL